MADDVKKKQQTQSAEQQGGQQAQTNQPSGQESGEMQGRWQGQQRGNLARRGSSLPSMFSLSPREFFRMNPFELMRRFTEEMDSAFENFGLSRGFGGGRMQMWSPSVEVFERGNNIVVHAELPGLNKDDVKVEMTDDGLVIQGERKREHEERGEGFYRSERSYGQFHRLIPLPEDANIDQASAKFENGILEVVVPIPESRRQRRSIPIGGSMETGGGQSQTATGGSGKK